MAATIPGRGAIAADPHGELVETQYELEKRDFTRREMWRETLQMEERYMGRSAIDFDEQYDQQWDLRVHLLGDQPKDEWLAELDGLLQTEVTIDTGYRALEWCARILGPRREEQLHYPTEGYDFLSPGLLFEAIQDDPDFGSPYYTRYYDIRNFREMEEYEKLQLVPDFEWLVAQEWELEKAYRKLFEKARPWIMADEGDTEEQLLGGHQESLDLDQQPDPEYLWRMQQMLSEIDREELTEPGAEVSTTLAPQPKLVNPQGGETVGLTQQKNCADLGEKEIGSCSFPQQIGLLEEETVGLTPMRQIEVS